MSQRAFLTLLTCLALTACGGSDDDNNGGDQGDQTDGPCAHTIGPQDDITVDTTWENTTSACDYFVSSYLIVTSATLTIEPGTVVRFAQDAAISISEGSQLIARGTADQRIVFRGASDTSGFCFGILLATERESTFDHVDVRNCGKEDNSGSNDYTGGITPRLYAPLSVTNSTFSRSRLNGLDLTWATVTGFGNNRFYDNTLFGLILGSSQSAVLDSGSDYLGGDAPNGRPYVELVGIINETDTWDDNTWKNVGAPYLIDNAVRIENGTTTVEAGVEVAFTGDSRLFVDGETSKLVINGTEQNPVRFHGEGGALWQGLAFFNADAEINHLDINDAAVAIDAVSNTTDRVPLSVIDIRNSEFTGNELAICVDYESELIVDDNSTISGGEAGAYGYTQPDLYDDVCP